MCVANSARSQIAEGLARKILGSDFEIASAGSKPTHVNQFAIKALHDIGIDISDSKSKSFEALSEIFKSNLDLVITLCDEEVCPSILSNCKKIHWPIPDPALFKGSDQEKLQKFSETRDLIFSKLENLKLELLRQNNR